MNRTIDWQPIITQVAGPMQANETRESWLMRAARRSHLTYRQVKKLYYGECRDPKTSVALSILTAAERARDEANKLAKQFETLAGGLHASDADFYGSDVLALVNAARALRGLDHQGKNKGAHPFKGQDSQP